MNELLTNKLTTKYPLLFPDAIEFQHDDGWYSILDALCMQIQSHCNKLNSNIDIEKKEGNCQVRVIQVKEKLGTLCFYINGGDDTIYALIEFAELLSKTTCEDCGRLGDLQVTSRMKTLCDSCITANRLKSKGWNRIYSSHTDQIPII